MPAKTQRSVLYRLLEGNPVQVINVGISLAGSGLVTPLSGSLNRSGLILTGFEEYTADADLTKLNWNVAGGLGGTVVLVTSNPRSGLKCLRLFDGGPQSLGYLDRTFPQTDDRSYYFRTYIRVTTFPTGKDLDVLHARNTTPSFQKGLAIQDTTHKLMFDSNGQGGGSGAVSAAVLAANTYYMLEMYLYRKAGVEAERQYRLSDTNGVLIEESAFFVTDPGAFNFVTLGTLTSGPSGAGYDYRQDDVAVKLLPGKQRALWIGNGHVGTWGISGTVSGTWTPTGGSPNGINVDEVPGASPNDADYNTSSTPTQVDRFSGAAVTVVIPTSKKVRLFGVNGRFFPPGSFGGATTKTRIWDPSGALFESAVFGPSVSAWDPIPIGGCVAVEMDGVTVADLGNLNIGYEKIGVDAIQIGALWGAFDWVD